METEDETVPPPTRLKSTEDPEEGGDPENLPEELEPPHITAHPQNQSVAEGQSATFTCGAEGIGIAYSWYRNGLLIASANATTLEVQGTRENNDTQYRCSVTNASQVVIVSATATLVVGDVTAPTLALDGATPSTTVESSVTLEGTASDASSGLDSVRVQSDRFPTPFGAAVNGSGVFVADVPLALGENALTVVARDRAGNEATSAVTITQTLPAVPRLAITSPSTGSETTEASVSVTGTVESSLSADAIRLSLGGAVTFPEGANGRLTFSFPNVALTEGTNVLTVTANTPHGTVSTQSIVTRRETSTTPEPTTPPVIAINAPSETVYVTGDNYVVAGSVTGSCPVSAVNVNGAAAAVTGQGNNVTFSREVAFATGASRLDIAVVATACTTATRSLTVLRDGEAPVLVLESLNDSPAVNDVLENPYRVRGTVSDANLAGASIDGASVDLLSSGTNEWALSHAVALVSQETKTLVVEAWDHAGNRTSRTIKVRLIAPVEIVVVTPRAGDRLVGEGDEDSVTVEARVNNLAPSDTLVATIDGGAAIPLTRTGALVRGELSDVATGAQHTLVVSVRNAQGGTEASKSVRFELLDGARIPIEVVRQEPANGATLVEANQPITVHFNRPVDPALLKVRVLETVHGRGYAEQGLGDDLTQMSSVSIVDVDRNHEAVPGHAMNFPGNQMFAFYPSRDYGYGGRVTIDVLYDCPTIDDSDCRSLSRSEITIRTIPTLVTGAVTDEVYTPIANIDVRIVELGMTVKTSADGTWDLGYGWAAAQSIPPGLYHAIANPNRANPIFGSAEQVFIVREGEVQNAGVMRLAAIDMSEPFRPMASHAPTNELAASDLVLDLTNARVTFPDGQEQGLAYAQFMDYSQLSCELRAPWIPMFGFGVQPIGIRSEGPVHVKITLPLIEQSWSYVSMMPTYGFLLATDPSTLALVPVGVMQIFPEVHEARTVQAVPIGRFDYIAFTPGAVGSQALIQKYVSGEMSLAQLTASIEATAQGVTP